MSIIEEEEEEERKERKRKKMSDYNSNVVDKIKQDRWAKVCMLSKEAMRAEIARLIHQGWQDRVGKIIGLAEKARKSTTIG